MIRKALTFASLLILLVTPVLADSAAEPLVYDPRVCWAAEEESLEAALEAAESSACQAMMRAFPRPEKERIPRDLHSLNNFSFWRVGPGAVNLYDGPGGGVVGQIPAGFNFVRARDTSVEGWIQRAGGEWLLRSDAREVKASNFAGMLLPEGWEHPYAIILDQTGVYASLRPGGAHSKESGFVTRQFKLVNIFARAEDDEGKVWYLVGPQQWLRQEFVAKFAATERPDGVTGRWVAVDLFEQSLIAYEDDTPVFATAISSGLSDWPTKEGIYEVWARLTSDSMSGAAGAPDAYALQHVPWVMYFHHSVSLHGTYWHDDFGYRRSHGCVNMSISDARWLYDWFLEAEPDDDGEIVSTVFVYSSGVYANG